MMITKEDIRNAFKDQKFADYISKLNKEITLNDILLYNIMLNDRGSGKECVERMRKNEPSRKD